MSHKDLENIFKYLQRRYKSHPWHGIDKGEKFPEVINAFIEIVPSDTVKYEIDKDSGYMLVDRPQKFSNIIPSLYGFVPQTYCMEKVAEYCAEKTGRVGIQGDEDPLDICVLSEREIDHGNIIVSCKPIGGFRMIDGGEADDKIIAVLDGDGVYGGWNDISEAPKPLIDRLKHYFLTYKELPGGEKKKIEITHTYGREEALEVVKRSYEDYLNHFGSIEDNLVDAFIQAFKQKVEA